MNMFFGLVLHKYVFLSLIFLLHDFPPMHIVNHLPYNFSNGPSLKNNIIILH